MKKNKKERQHIKDCEDEIKKVAQAG